MHRQRQAAWRRLISDGHFTAPQRLQIYRTLAAGYPIYRSERWTHHRTALPRARDRSNVASTVLASYVCTYLRIRDLPKTQITRFL